MAAGLGTRMRSAVPKHLHPVLGRRLVDWVIAAAHELGVEPLVVVTSPSTEDAFEGAGVEVAVQDEPLGTGDAVRSAREALEARGDDLLVLSGDTPCLTPTLLRELAETHRREQAAATVLTFVPDDPRAYGRVLRNGAGHVQAIVEAGDASPDELSLEEVNSSIYVFRASSLWPALERLEPRNVQGELYLTDVVRRLVEDGETVAAHVAADPRAAEGVNTRSELASAAAVLRARINEGHMLAGVTMVDPGSTWIEPGVELEPDVTIHPWVYLRGRTRVGSNAEIHSHSVVVDAEIGRDAIVGPFCYLRPGTALEASSKAGTFVEIKNSRIGERTKVPHLSYIGDAEIGEDTNIGAGTVTANLPHEPGRPKARTRIGKNVRTGIQNGFVAPVEVGDGAWTAAGSVITKDVPPDALAVARARQENKEGYAARHRDD
jgi:bifunctional UDP-N-acetylglucosamine pyrophosphorylase/glucosamine-1-phosphate N-acetyltransferase